MPYYVYILQSVVNDSFYKGSTGNLKNRLEDHNNSKEKSTARYVPWNLVWYAEKSTRSEAVILEKKLKNLSRIKTVQFIEKYKAENVIGGPDVAPVRQSGC